MDAEGGSVEEEKMLYCNATLCYAVVRRAVGNATGKSTPGKADDFLKREIAACSV